MPYTVDNEIVHGYATVSLLCCFWNLLTRWVFHSWKKWLNWNWNGPWERLQEAWTLIIGSNEPQACWGCVGGRGLVVAGGSFSYRGGLDTCFWGFDAFWGQLGEKGQKFSLEVPKKKSSKRLLLEIFGTVVHILAELCLNKNWGRLRWRCNRGIVQKMVMYNKVFTKLLWHRRRKHDFGIMAFLRQLKITTGYSWIPYQACPDWLRTTFEPRQLETIQKQF